MHKNGDKAELSRVNEAYRNFVKVQLVPLLAASVLWLVVKLYAGSQLDQITETRQKKSKKFAKLRNHTCTCNNLTSFEYKTHSQETEIVVNLLKFAWKNS